MEIFEKGYVTYLHNIHSSHLVFVLIFFWVVLFRFNTFSKFFKQKKRCKREMKCTEKQTQCLLTPITGTVKSFVPRLGIKNELCHGVLRGLIELHFVPYGFQNGGFGPDGSGVSHKQWAFYLMALECFGHFVSFQTIFGGHKFNVTFFFFILLFINDQIVFVSRNCT